MATAVGDRLSTHDGPATPPPPGPALPAAHSNPIELDACTVCGTRSPPRAPGRGATLRGAVGGDAGLPTVSEPRPQAGRPWTGLARGAVLILATMAIVVLASGLESAIDRGPGYLRGRRRGRIRGVGRRRITSPPGTPARLVEGPVLGVRGRRTGVGGAVGDRRGIGGPLGFRARWNRPRARS